MSKSIAKNAFYSGVRTLSTMLFPLITYPYVTRVLMADNLGRIDFSVSIISYFTLVAGLGIASYATREGARIRDDREKLDRFSSEVFTINMVSTLGAYVLLAVLYLAWPHLHNYQSLMAIQATSIIGTTLGVEWLYTLSEDFGYITARTLVVQVVSTVLLFVLVKKPSDYLIYAGITVFSSVGANLFNFFRSGRYATIRLVWNFDAKRHLLPMIILFGNALASSIYINIDVTLLNIMRGDYAVGIYSVAVKIYRIVKQFLNAIISVSIPRLSLYLGQKDDQGYRDLLGNILHGLFIVVLPALGLLFFLSDYVVLIVGGASFAESTTSLRILSLALMPAVLANFAVNSILLPNRQERLILRTTTVGAVINLVTNFVAIPLWSADGAAVTTALAELAVLGTAVWYGRPYCDYTGLIKSQRKPILAAVAGTALIGAVCLTINGLMGTSLTAFFVSGAVGVCGYALILLVSKDSIVLSFIKKYVPKSPDE